MSKTSKGTHEYQDDPRNADILIDINGEHLPRGEARVSVFDSGFVLGDGVWEGLRVHQGKIAFLEAHLERLYEGAKALDMEMEVDAEELTRRLYRLLEKNRMRDGVHIRLMVTRGIKATPYQDPRITVTPPTIVIIAEHSRPASEAPGPGLRLHTVPGTSGDTLFSSMYAVYDNLSDDMKRHLAGLTAIHEGEQIFRGYRTACRDWAYRKIDIEAFRAQALAGVYICLAADATPDFHRELVAKLEALG